MPWTWRAVATPGRDSGPSVESGALVRVLAVAQFARQLAAERAPLGRALLGLAREPIGNRRVIGRRARVGLLRHLAAEAQPRRAVVGLQFLEQARIILDVDDHDDVGVILRRGANHRGAADVDVLDHLVERRGALKRVLERIEVDHQEIDGRDAVRDHRRLMRGIGTNGEQAAVDARMQRLQPAVHHFRKSGELRDVDDGDARFRERRGGAAGGDDLDLARREGEAQLGQSGLVGDGNQRAADMRETIDGHGRDSQGWRRKGRRALSRFRRDRNSRDRLIPKLPRLKARRHGFLCSRAAKKPSRPD